MQFRVGIGYDVHKFDKDRKLIIGGVEIPYEKGLAGHSDADVLVHSVIDCLLGALKEGDIGTLFPDTSKEFKNISSLVLLQKVYSILTNRGYLIGNIDCVIIAQKPKMRPYISQMEKNIAEILNIDLQNINIKATTEEGLGFTGREEGIASKAICLLYKSN